MAESLNKRYITLKSDFGEILKGKNDKKNSDDIQTNFWQKEFS